MNALKKAESAKQSSAPSVNDNPAGVDPGRDLAQELGLDPPGKPGASTTVRSAGSLQGPGPGGLELELEPASQPTNSESQLERSGRTAIPEAPYSRGSATTQADRNTAKAVFAAKQPPKSNPRLPFYMVVGACLLGGAGYGYYLWLQMQPVQRPPATVAQFPTPQKGPQTASAPAPAPAPAAVTPPVEQNPDGAPSNVPAMPLADQKFDREAERADKGMAAGLSQAALGGLGATSASLKSANRDAASAAGGGRVESPANLRITRDSITPAINPDVQAGYAALQSGDLDRAGQAYDRALRSEPANRDALLGAATVLMRLNRPEAAEAYFRQTLRLHPQDAYAASQLAALGARSDPVGALSQVNSLIARESERAENSAGSGALAFVQGNQLAAQERWPEAQQAYFNAHRADPANPDYCFNLAVSLDRMHEARLARDFYSKALELARARAAGFDLAQAQKRLSQINSAAK